MRRKATVWRMASASPGTFRPLTRYGPDLILPSARVLPTAEMPGLRSRMNDALLELAYGDPLNAWADIPVLELSGPLERRSDAVLAALDQA